MEGSRLWIEKYTPKDLEEMDFHEELNKNLISLTSHDDLPHLLLYGPNGSGKRTRVRALLQRIFGNSIYNMRGETRGFQATKSTTTECVVLSSKYHIEVTPSEAAHYDRVVVQKLIKEVAGTQVLEGKGKRFKVIILHEVDKLTIEAQAALRRTMEKYMMNCRLILVAENLSKLITPLRSRTLMLRVGAPTIDQIHLVIYHIINKEHLGLLDEKVIDTICQLSNRNLRRAIMMLQTFVIGGGKGPTDIIQPAFYKVAKGIAKSIIQAQTPQQ